jgi:hypothetical protein
MGMTQMVSAEQMSSAASYLIRNWGEYGYRIGVEAAGFTRAAFLCRASDGSEFRFLVDRYGNTVDLPDAPSLDRALELLPAEQVTS